jgi:pilus assembly protein TadC
MDQHSIRKFFLLYLLLSGLFFNGLFAVPNEVNARELKQIAQSGADEEGDDEDDEDC